MGDEPKSEPKRVNAYMRLRRGRREHVCAHWHSWPPQLDLAFEVGRQNWPADRVGSSVALRLKRGEARLSAGLRRFRIAAVLWFFAEGRTFGVLP